MPRLDSKLSRLLLDDGHLPTDQLENAAKQQLVQGGALDTVLLEMGLIDEPTVTQALSRAWSTAPVDLKTLKVPRGQAADWIPQRMAVRMALCPIKQENASLHVLVAAPVDFELLQEIGELTNKTLVPHVVTEVRLMATIGQLYDIAIDERFVSLLVHLDSGVEGSLQPPEEDETQTAVEKSSWDLVEALANLAAQDNRRGINKIALQFARQHLPFAAIFGVRANHAEGWARSGGSGPLFGRVSLPVPANSVLRQVVDSPSPLLGKPPEGAGNQALLTWLGRQRPSTALLVPIIVAGKTVALLYADGGAQPRTYDELSDLVAFGARLGPAFEALLRVRHRENEEVFGSRSEEVTLPFQEAPADTIASHDGSSPFAQGYQREAPPAPVMQPPPAAVATTVEFDDEGRWSLADTPHSPTVQATDEHASTTVDPQRPWRPRASAMQPDIDWSDDADEEDVTLDGVLLAELTHDTTAPAANETTPPPRTTHASSSSHEGSQTHAEPTILRVTGEPEALDEPEEDIIWHGEPGGMTTVGVVSTADQQQFAQVADELEEVVQQGTESAGKSETDTTSTEDEDAASSGQGTDPHAKSAKVFGDLSEESAPSEWTHALEHATAVQSASAASQEPILPQEDGWDDVTWDGALRSVAEREVAAQSDPASISEHQVQHETNTSSPALSLESMEASDEHDEIAVEQSEAPVELTSPRLSPDEVAKMPAAPGLTPDVPKDDREQHTARTDKVTNDTSDNMSDDLPVEASDDVSSDLAETVSDSAMTAPPMAADDVDVVLHTDDVDVSLSSGDAESSLEIGDDRVSLEESHTEGDAHKQPLTTEPSEPAFTIEDAADMLRSSHKARVREAQNFLRKQGEAAVPALTSRFPGRLLIDPSSSERVLTASGADFSPLMELLQSMGPIGLDAAIPHLDSTSSGHRFCATFLFKLVPDERCLELLLKRLHDQVPNIRLAAAAAMDEFIAHPRFAHVLQHLRDRLASPIPRAQASAIFMLGQFSDVGAVPSLIDKLDSNDNAVRSAAHVALCEICLVNHGKKSKAWLKWWKKARKRSRVDWVIDALRSHDHAVRKVARLELANLTGGDDFGFQPEGNKREREQIVRSVESWWNEQRPEMRA